MERTVYNLNADTYKSWINSTQATFLNTTRIDNLDDRKYVSAGIAIGFDALLNILISKRIITLTNDRLYDNSEYDYLSRVIEKLQKRVDEYRERIKDLESKLADWNSYYSQDPWFD